LKEYVVEAFLRDINPHDSIKGVIEAPKLLLKQAREEIRRANVRQAIGKV